MHRRQQHIPKLMEEQHEQKEDENNVHALKDLIIAKQEDPEPCLLHALAAIFETAKTRYKNATDDVICPQDPVFLCDLIWGDKKFSRLLHSFLQNAYLVSVKVAAARLFSSCSPWMRGDLPKGDALDKTKDWVRYEIPRRLMADDCNPMHETGRRKDLDSEMMCTYYTGLLATVLDKLDNQLAREVLTCKLPAKLMRYLSIRISDETNIGAKKITALVEQAVDSEAKAAKALAVAVRAAAAAADADAAEVVKTAAFEEYKKTSDEEKYAELLRLSKLREKFCIRCLVILGRREEVLDLVLCKDGVNIILALLQKSSEDEKTSSTILLLHDVLELISVLVNNIGFAKLFVEGGGIERLIAVRRSDQTFGDLSSCLLMISKSEGIMESICTLPSNVVGQLVELALQLLECQHHPSRLIAAIFFNRCYAFRPANNAFDEQRGPLRLLHILRGASLRSGHLYRLLPNYQSTSQALNAFETLIAADACTALKQYFIAKFLLLADSLSVGADNMRVDPSPDTLDAVLRQIQKDQVFGLALVRKLRSAVGRFLGAHGHKTLLEMYQAHPAEVFWGEVPAEVLQVLSIVALVPSSHKVILNATLRNGQTVLGLILGAADDAGYVKCKVTVLALKVLTNLVSLPWINDELIGSTESEVKEVRQAIRGNHGFAVLLRLLQPEELKGGYHCEWIWALTCRVLLSFAREHTIADALRKMQLEEKLSMVVKGPGRHAPEWRLPEVDHDTKELLRVLTISEHAATSDDQSIFAAYPRVT
ncbi:DDB1- and CUL4-associated factor homolog 1-like isoform X2 [Primulina huaijiensis]|uniref:DDB1- and CUL4-associated factor homolog 1-like isoform X2 n=1 Tax=Primulina huaijiensis TaxID=1492673 RepID=UPI003CC7630D